VYTSVSSVVNFKINLLHFQKHVSNIQHIIYFNNNLQREHFLVRIVFTITSQSLFIVKEVDLFFQNQCLIAPWVGPPIMPVSADKERIIDM
jgi:hypothetical protein